MGALAFTAGWRRVAGLSHRCKKERNGNGHRRNRFRRRHLRPDLRAVSLAEGGHDYGQYVRDAENANLSDVASFFREVMEQDSARAARCHEMLTKLSGSEHAGPAAQ
jgi:hypothetical protein